MIGYEAFVNDGVVWKKSQGAISPLSRSRPLETLAHSQCKRILVTRGGYLLRWESEFDRSEESSWWHIIKDHPDTISSLKKKTRYLVRKSAKEYEVKMVDVDTIKSVGYQVYVRAYERYSTHEKMYLENDFLSAVDSVRAETEWWGVFDKVGRLVGFSENYVNDDSCNYITIWIEPSALKNFAGYLLFFEMEQHYLCKKRLKYVSNGTRNISHDTNIHDFLLQKFGYRKAYSILNVVYAPWIGFMIHLIYPMRGIFEKIKWGVSQRIAVLLRQEEINRQCAKERK